MSAEAHDLADFWCSFKPGCPREPWHLQIPEPEPIFIRPRMPP